MRRFTTWAPAGLMGVAGVLAGLTFGAAEPDSLGAEALISMAVTTVAITFWGGALVVLPLGVLAWAIRRAALGTAAPELRTMLDLGGDRRVIVRDEALRGLRAGAIASGIGVVLGLTVAMTLPYYSPIDGGMQVPNLAALAGLLFAYTALAVATGAVYALAAVSASRPGPRPGVAADAVAAGVQTPGARRGPGRALLVQLALFALGAGGLLAYRVAGHPSESLGSTTTTLISVAIGAATVVAASSGVALAARLLSGTTVRVAAWAGEGLAQLLSWSTQGIGLAARIAADGLRHRTGTRTLAAGAMAGIMVLATMISVSRSIDAAEDQVNEAFEIDFTIAATDLWWPEESDEPTVVRDALDKDFVSAMLEDERVIAIPYGMVAGVAVRWENSYWATEDGGLSQVFAESFMVVDPADLELRSEGGLTPVGFQDGVFTNPMADGLSNASPTDQTATADLFELVDTNVGPFVTRAWAESHYGDVPIVGMILWLADEDAAAAEVGNGHKQLRAIIAEHGGAELNTLGVSGGDKGWPETFDAALLVWVLLIMGVALTLMLASTSVRDRRRELATLSALGASPRAIRLSPAVEVAVTVASSAIVGIGFGTLAALVWSHPTLLGIGAPFDPATALWIMGWDLSHASLALPLAVAAAGLVLSVLAALLLGSGMAKGTPVEELRTADKEGVR